MLAVAVTLPFSVGPYPGYRIVPVPYLSSLFRALSLSWAVRYGIYHSSVRKAFYGTNPLNKLNTMKKIEKEKENPERRTKREGTETYFTQLLKQIERRF
jgi:hypothetical protein